MNRLAWAFGITLLVGGAGQAIDIGFCGSGVPPGQVGVLQADLTCSGVGVELEEMATLQMNGHSISGGSIGVFCSRRCTIQGPGEIVGATNFGIVTSTNPSPRVVVEDVTIRDGAGSAIALGQGGPGRPHERDHYQQWRRGVRDQSGSYPGHQRRHHQQCERWSRGAAASLRRPDAPGQRRPRPPQLQGRGAPCGFDPHRQQQRPGLPRSRDPSSAGCLQHHVRAQRQGA